MTATFLPLGLAAAIGALCGVYRFLPPSISFLISILCIVLYLSFYSFKFNSDRLRLFILCLTVTATWCTWVSQRTVRPVTPTIVTEVFADCELLDEPRYLEHGYSFRVKLLLPETPYCLRAYSLREPVGLVPGDRMRVIGTIKPFQTPLYGGEQAQNIQAAVTGTQAKLTIKQILRTEKTVPEWKRRFFEARNDINFWVKTQIAKYLTGDSGILAESLLLGNYQQLDDEILIDFRRTGLVHLLALSGLQLMMIWGMFEGLGSILRLPIKYRLAFILLGVLCYRMLLPAMASVDRAFVMALWFIGSRFAGVKLSGWQAWGGALFMLSIMTPSDVASPGFQLSFAAVAGLLLVLPMQQKLIEIDPEKNNPFRKVWHWVLIGSLTSLAAITASAPILVYHFGYLSYTGLLLNLPAVPLSAVILFGTILLCCVSWIPLFATIVGLGTERCGDFLIWLAQFPGSAWGVGSDRFYWIGLISVGLFLWMIAWTKNRRWMRYAGWSMMIVAVIGLLVSNRFVSDNQQQLLSTVYCDGSEAVYVATDDDAAIRFQRSWNRVFGNRPLIILLLSSNPEQNAAMVPGVSIVKAGDAVSSDPQALTTTILWHTVARECNEMQSRGWGYLTDRSGVHHPYLDHLSQETLERLGWTWIVPVGKRDLLQPTDFTANAKWLVDRWNQADETH